VEAASQVAKNATSSDMNTEEASPFFSQKVVEATEGGVGSVDLPEAVIQGFGEAL